MSRLLGFLGICCFVCLAAVGCGGSSLDLAPVTGTVTMDGEPVENALVTFTPEGGGRSASGTTDASGKYQLATGADAGALIGQHRVTVTSLNVAEDSADTEMSSDSDAYMNQAMGDPSAYDEAETEEKIPAKYNTESTLAEEVTAGDNVIDLPLTSD